MNPKIRSVAIYLVTILVSIFAFIGVGAELITQYQMYSTNTPERHLLAEDMGFGLLLMFGLVPEIFLGSLFGWFLGRKINQRARNT